MRNPGRHLLLVAQSLALALVLTACASRSDVTEPAAAPAHPIPERNITMKSGAFSISLAVKDIAASRAFYEKLGFTKFGGDEKQNWLILQNEDRVTIGLFQGMFELNIMTFNPGWTQAATAMDDFRDVRDIQAELQEKGITPVTAADPDSTGPASFVLADPDGNSILFDQHVPRPGSE